ncbi:phosphonate C-P lyase system protein PhnG [Rhizobium rosettiformans]|uniref:phosphonate C-P lyase system protein PhnG n=1 Tax=Rhizobium rosettiformans TaxID=1368430 RepID=UPI002860F549|nr:phosphonate C-P lyase system protein PhnG [Rhizobium rosettiformans]MDR7030170.1 alpha-D-ribose 1-methylphosphonate 5-triphosphate synthase subunit PhnG [Rhizobium rosettiformans]MDR7065849.1 alpha-D-ribose 1-methylphosphonate 5-triphosphate synthase subunit PhnG [Rhizobium rosettiformans]
MDTAREIETGPQIGRKRIADLLAKATIAELESALAALGPIPDFTALRGPETGLVMVKGRIGGGGAPFNLGEATVSRASIRLADGRVGHGYRLGTDRKSAQLSAVLDALAQDEAARNTLETALFAPLEARLAQEAERLEAETAATKVDFFTMVRGED